MKIIRYFSRGIACVLAALLMVSLLPVVPVQAAEEPPRTNYTGSLVEQSGTLLAEGTPVTGIISFAGIGENEGVLPTPESYIRESFDSAYLTVTEASMFEAQDVLHIKQTLVDKSIVPGDYSLDELMGSDSTDEAELEAQAELFIVGVLQQHETDIALYDPDPTGDYLVGIACSLWQAEAAVQDYCFAWNDLYGHEIGDCVFDPTTGLVYVPRSYIRMQGVRYDIGYACDENGNHLELDQIDENSYHYGCTQLQLMIAMDAQETTATQVEVIYDNGLEQKTVTGRIVTPATGMNTPIALESHLAFGPEYIPVGADILFNGATVPGFEYDLDYDVLNIAEPAAVMNTLSIHLYMENVGNIAALTAEDAALLTTRAAVSGSSGFYVDDDLYSRLSNAVLQSIQNTTPLYKLNSSGTSTGETIILRLESSPDESWLGQSAWVYAHMPSSGYAKTLPNYPVFRLGPNWGQSETSVAYIMSGKVGFSETVLYNPAILKEYTECWMAGLMDQTPTGDSSTYTGRINADTVLHFGQKSGTKFDVTVPGGTYIRMACTHVKANYYPDDMTAEFSPTRYGASDNMRFDGNNLNNVARLFFRLAGYYEASDAEKQKGITGYLIIGVGKYGPYNNDRVSQGQTVEANGDQSGVGFYKIAYYDPESTYNEGKIEVFKKGSDGKTLSGAEFTIYDSTGKVFDKIITNSSGYGIREQVSFGTYTVVETKFPTGYGMPTDTTKWTVTLNKDTPNGTVTINAVNSVTTGKAQIVKNTTNGGSKAGWHFTVKNASGSAVGTYTTDASGVITLNLEPGTYTVTETNGASDYWVNDPQPTKTVTVTAGQTATVTFTNRYIGKAQIVKNTTNGGSKAGWHFIVKNASGNTVGTYATDASGVITLGLEPGTYTVTETNGASDYWVNDPQPTKTVTVTAGQTATVTFTNRYIGKAQIVKNTTNGGSKAGWHFTVKNASGSTVGTYATDASGVITLDLEPGTYTVTETDGAADYWVNDPQSTKTVTVTAGQTATVTFTNRYIGKAQIVKNTTNGGSKAGWHFTVKNASGNTVGTYATDASGVITLDLEPGTYTVTETDGAADYWINDPQPIKTVTVTAGQTATVTFTNRYLGKAQIVKNTTNGGSKAGWHFTVKNASGNTVGTYATDASGVITLDLEPGTYTVTETDGAADYWVNDPQPTKTVTVTAGQTATVTFTNRYLGKAQIVKNTTNGGSKAGWRFTVKNASGNTVGTYTTDASGVITLNLEPGTYYIKETGARSGVDISYWIMDTTVKTVTVKAGETASVTFENQWNGKAKIVKKLANPEAGSLEGWPFTVKNPSGGTVGTFTTNASGEILLDLEPGTYTITENIPENSPWECQGGITQTVTVKAGQAAVVTYTNALRPGKVTAHKVGSDGNSLPGTTFLLEWSQDGKTWKPLIKSSAVTMGGCQSEGLENGCLTTDAGGTVVFEGLYPTLYYRLTEVKAPEGHELSYKVLFEGKLDPAQDFELSGTVTDDLIVLPMTGSYDFCIVPLAVVGALCSVWLLVTGRKRKTY